MKITCKNPLLSIVVIGRNEGERLVRCLESVRNMENPGCEAEIIYVDSASTDGSPDVATGMGAKVVSVQARRPTAALGRNKGWRATRGKYVLFLDGDTILDPKFVRSAILHFYNSKNAVVFGHRREIYPKKSVYNRVLDLDWISPVGAADYCGGDALVRREVLEKVGGYDENLIAGEEPEMCRRIRALGCKIEHLDLPMTTHDLAITRFSQYWRRAMRTGYAYAEVSTRFRGSEMPFWEADVKRNVSRGGILTAVCLLSLATSLCIFSILPLTAFILFFAGFSLRSAYKMRWKTSNFFTLLLYGIHSQFQHLPILAGQIQFHFDRRQKRRRNLIEYKKA